MAAGNERTRERPRSVTREREVGRRRLRKEDRPLVTGDGEYTDDLADPALLHLAVHRSRYAHARVTDIDTSAAEAHEGVVAVFTAADLAAAGLDRGYRVEGPGDDPATTELPLLAADRVRYAGEPLAVVVAEDRYDAASAAALVDVASDRLDAVVGVENALAEDAPVVHDDQGSNRAFGLEFGDAGATDRAFAAADTTVSLSLSNQRLAPTAMEPRGVHADYDAGTAELVVTMSTQVPHRAKGRLAEVLPIDEAAIRVVAPDVGGGFGSKGGSPYPEEPLTAWASMELGRPVKWVATRTEALQSDYHGRDVHADAALALDADGTIRGLRIDARFDLGAYLVWGTTPAPVFRTLVSGQYAIGAIHGELVGAFTNTTPIAPYRGAGRPEALFVLERLVAQAAAELGMDPADLRRRNLIPPEAFPFETAHGVGYDSGNYERALDEALDLVGYDDWRERQAAARAEGRYLGVGLGCFVENTGPAPGRGESARIRIDPDGRVVAHCGTSDHGQGHETTFSQVVADELGVDFEAVDVVEGDTADLAEGVGTFGSRSAPVGASALVVCAGAFRERARDAAARRFGVAPDAVAYTGDGTLVVEGGDQSISVGDLAAALADDGEGPLEAAADYDPEGFAFAFGTHVAVVEVDPDAGEVAFRDYVAVDDVGTVFNPTIVEGQVMGGVAQGVGQALTEHAAYDETGTLATGSLQDYAVPRAHHVPEMTVGETETPSPLTPTGAKGAGEGGSIGAPPAVVNAVVDALRPLGVDDVEMPVTAETVWRAVREVDGS